MKKLLLILAFACRVVFPASSTVDLSSVGGFNAFKVDLVQGVALTETKDSSRTAKIYYATNAASGSTTTETAITLTKSSGTSATSSAVSFVITSGKKFRIESMIFAALGNVTGTVQSTVFNLRINTGGAVTTGSTPILAAVRVSTPATSLAYDRATVSFPEGYEITGDGTLQFGVTAAATYTTNAPTWDVMIVGYEY